MKKIFLLALLGLSLASCKKDTKNEPEPEPTPVDPCPPTTCINPDTIFNLTGTGPRLIFKFKFDSTQARFDNFGKVRKVYKRRFSYKSCFNDNLNDYFVDFK